MWDMNRVDAVIMVYDAWYLLSFNVYTRLTYGLFK